MVTIQSSRCKWARHTAYGIDSPLADRPTESEYVLYIPEAWNDGFFSVWTENPKSLIIQDGAYQDLHRLTLKPRCGSRNDALGQLWPL